MDWCGCNKATLYPDGAVRCDLTGRQAVELCEEQEPGLPKLYVRGKVKKQSIKRGSGGKS